MANLNRYKFTFGDKQLTLTTEHDKQFMATIEDLALEKYRAIQAEMPHADRETLALLLAVNSLSVQLKRELVHAQALAASPIPDLVEGVR